MAGKKTVRLPPENLKINTDENAYRKKYRFVLIVFTLFMFFYLLRTYKYHALKDLKTNKIPQQLAYAVSATLNFILDATLSFGAGMFINAVANKFWFVDKYEPSIYKGFN